MSEAKTTPTSKITAADVVRKTNAGEFDWKRSNAFWPGVYLAKTPSAYTLRFARRPIVGGISSTLEILDSSSNVVSTVKYSGADRDAINAAVMNQLDLVKNYKRWSTDLAVLGYPDQLE